MKKLNPDYTKGILDYINQAPYFKLLSMRALELDYGYFKLETLADERHHSPLASVHGGAFASIIDTVAYWAVICDIPEDVGATTIDIKVDYLSNVSGGRLISEGRKIKVGRSLCLTEATVKDESGRLLVHGSSKLLLMPTLPSIRQLVSEKGLPELPPKFL